MQAPSEKISRPNNLLKQLLAAAFALFLLWFAFKGTNLKELWHYSQNVKPFPIVLIFVSGIFGTFLRSYRWTILLRPLSDKKISQYNSFYAVMIGYAVNVAIPRGGEVVRLLSICKSENLPWAGVLSTMLIDRMLDIALLVSLLGATLMILPPELLASMPWLKPGGLALLVGVVVGLVALPNVGAILKKLLGLNLAKTRLPEKLRERFQQLAEQFDTGTQALKNPVLYPYIAFLSVAIWFTYWLNFYQMVYGFGLEDKISPLQCLIIFTIGSAGVLVPTPGSVGSFHLLVKEATVMTAHIPPDQALAFATVLHFLTFIAVCCIPALALFFYNRFIVKK
ncbi:MAG: lysylphosphatidylglycerol synthase transmembrane domain-containing protein [Candidatus Melainabacteria bacterium]|nr:lysylphosphatidylglycerol synthase transmembrane domain-containing protein [Candidatus Melainabacteria bacterium]